MLKAVKLRLYPTSEQASSLRFQFGASRWVYNRGLEWRKKSWEENRESVSLRTMLDELVVLKREHETEWLKGADSQVLQQSLMHLDHAFRRFFRQQGGYPRFKNRHARQSVSYPQRVKLVGSNRLRLPKVGDVKVVVHRALIGKIKTVTVSLSRTGKYFASVLLDDGKAPPTPPQEIRESEVIGVDLGIAQLITDSNGNKTPHPHVLARCRSNLRRKQKSLSRKQKGSSNRAKARVQLAKVHERVAHVRKDIHHKISKHLIDENQAVCAETLDVRNMLRNRRLSRPIQDASWSTLVCMLAYKSEWYGKHFVQIDRWFPSSKTCSGCGMSPPSMDLGVRSWTCPECGTTHDRDVNAAINIKQEGIQQLKTAGLSVSACGGQRKTDILSVAA